MIVSYQNERVQKDLKKKRHQGQVERERERERVREREFNLIKESKLNNGIDSCLEDKAKTRDEEIGEGRYFDYKGSSLQGPQACMGQILKAMSVLILRER